MPSARPTADRWPYNLWQPLPHSNQKLGLWLIGAGGNVATTVGVGLAALRHGIHDGTGLLTQTASFLRFPLVKLSDIVLGGHEIGSARPMKTAAELSRESGLFGEGLLKKIAPTLHTWQANIRQGTSIQCGAAIERIAGLKARRGSQKPWQAVAGIRADLRSFAQRNRLRRVVVINVASTEPPFRLTTKHRTWDGLSSMLRSGAAALPASSLYALAAIEEGMPYVNFTPSLGADVPALRERANQNRVPIMGSDGKTGETLIRSVLAPMFRERNLEVLSWAGYNILGNRDGQVLASPRNRASKLEGKNNSITSLVGATPQTTTSIEYLSSLHDWKTAWDHVHFRGFLGVKMSLQFTWQGCDSILAAPLVIDLARLADFHANLGLAGIMTHLACYFKAPMDVEEQSFTAQMQMLRRYLAHAARHKGGS